MRCEINLSWKALDETMSLAREKANDELWVSPLEDSSASVIPQIVSILDATYADVRAALISTLPKEMQENFLVVVKMTAEQARNFVEGQR